MFSHVTVGSNDLAASRRFYDALFAALGGRPGMTDEDGKLVYIKDGRMFIVTPPIDGQPACHANGGTIGFALENPQVVHAWQEAGMAHGGSAIEDPAGVRHKAGRQLYLAYLRDPDGNKLCAVHVMG
ncbi:TPA: VOC family protein [Stenotrophomonas maltophilia]|nr:VOC family protein [Stenotrophomonas maltophilia]HDS1027846.1 VOC family protein [Stenotrophomonas maltophilia]HDS1032015.1 VOC family protein [Stenotrophomonas maltophilia]HDS1036593.1 VOC family protein [Stenotrophomonas maltophilia]